MGDFGTNLDNPARHALRVGSPLARLLDAVDCGAECRVERARAQELQTASLAVTERGGSTVDTRPRRFRNFSAVSNHIWSIDEIVALLDKSE
jgi:hypothetical protein